MSSARIGSLWILAGLAALATAHVQCDCDNASTCAADLDCQQLEWTEVCAGHWACIEGDCTAVCDDTCADAQDCDGLDWPGGVGCAEADGHWECQAQECAAVCDDPPGCQQASDCEGEDWPYDDPELHCPEETGHWECEAEACVAHCFRECELVADCMNRTWTEGCGGHWACDPVGRCLAMCDVSTCGDGGCDTAGGENEGSCPADCLTGCGEAQDCLARAWDLPCQGVWTCVAGECEPSCNYTSCGDENCDAAGGESEAGCPDDCLAQCRAHADCLENTWSEFCRGYWNCFQGNCLAECETVRCGDGTCSPENGESQNGCDRDCLAGPCSEAAECAAYEWTEGCDGHWTCSASGACEPACDAGTCPDGACDVLAGETPGSCANDCSGYACLVSGDCAALTLPAGCDGEFLCVERVCRPICP